MCSPNTYACKGVFNPNISIFPPNSAEGLHFSAFHCYIAVNGKTSITSQAMTGVTKGSGVVNFISYDI